MQTKVVLERVTSSGTIQQLENSILVYRPHEGLQEPRLEFLKEDLEVFKEITQGIPHPYFSDNRQLNKLGSKEKAFIARTFHEFASHAACLVESPLTRFLHNTFTYLYRPSLPIRIFNDETEAFAWLTEKMKQ